MLEEVDPREKRRCVADLPLPAPKFPAGKKRQLPLGCLIL